MNKALKQEIINLYHKECLSTYEIANKLNISQSVVRYHLRNTKLRDHVNAQHTYLDKHKHQRIGTKHLDESKRKISEALKGKIDGKEENETTEEIQSKEISTGGEMV